MDQWFPGAIVRPGPAWKSGYTNYSGRVGKGAVVHSAEGYLSGAMGVLDSQARKSWGAFLAKDGQVYQHYELQAITWHAGFDANIALFGIETEGVAGEPLTDGQLATLIAFLRWQREQEVWPEVSRASTLREHNEFMSTSCPSGRIPWERVIEGLEEWPTVDEKAMVYACVSAAQFARMHWEFRDLHELDKRALRYIVSKLD